MLSIIVSSHKEDLYKNLEDNILRTIGIEYEIIRIPNYGEMSIGQAYNLGASKSLFSYLLFLHEDVEFKTFNWGQLLIKHLNEEDVGIIGLAGSNYVPQVPNDWGMMEPYNFIHLIHGKGTEIESIFQCQNTRNRVFSIDGLFLAIRKEIFNEFQFDETLEGFHSYDLSISLRIAKKYNNYVINNILVHHFSKGNPDKNWFLSNIMVKEELGSDYNHPKNDFTEYLIYKKFIRNAIRFLDNNTERYKQILKYYPKFNKIRPILHFKLIYYIGKSFLFPERIIK